MVRFVLKKRGLCDMSLYVFQICPQQPNKIKDRIISISAVSGGIEWCRLGYGTALQITMRIYLRRCLSTTS